MPPIAFAEGRMEILQNALMGPIRRQWIRATEF